MDIISQKNRDKLTVSGYVRQKTNDRNIPLEIINIILDYFLIILDSWDSTYNAHLKITDEYKVENLKKLQHNAAYGNLVIKEGEIYKWKIKLTKYKFVGGNRHAPYIGIIKDSADLNYYKTHGHNFKDDGYLFCCGARQVLRPGNKKYGGSGNSTYFNKVGDIIEMTLDLNNYTLSYCHYMVNISTL